MVRTWVLLARIAAVRYLRQRRDFIKMKADVGAYGAYGAQNLKALWQSLMLSHCDWLPLVLLSTYQRRGCQCPRGHCLPFPSLLAGPEADQPALVGSLRLLNRAPRSWPTALGWGSSEVEGQGCAAGSPGVPWTGVGPRHRPHCSSRGLWGPGAGHPRLSLFLGLFLGRRGGHEFILIFAVSLCFISHTLKDLSPWEVFLHYCFLVLVYPKESWFFYFMFIYNHPLPKGFRQFCYSSCLNIWDHAISLSISPKNIKTSNFTVAVSILKGKVVSNQLCSPIYIHLMEF